MSTTEEYLKCGAHYLDSCSCDPEVSDSTKSEMILMKEVNGKKWVNYDWHECAIKSLKAELKREIAFTDSVLLHRALFENQQQKPDDINWLSMKRILVKARETQKLRDKGE